MFTGTPKTPDEINKSRKLYQKEVSVEAKGITGFIKEILTLDPNLVRFHNLSAEEIMFSDAERENNLHMSKSDKNAESEIKSTLTWRLSEPAVTNTIKRIEGIIEGRKIKIDHDDRHDTSFGKIDGEEISRQDAALIWDKYSDVAQARTKRLRKLDQEKIEEKTQEKIKNIL